MAKNYGDVVVIAECKICERKFCLEIIANCYLINELTREKNPFRSISTTRGDILMCKDCAMRREELKADQKRELEKFDKKNDAA